MNFMIIYSICSALKFSPYLVDCSVISYNQKTMKACEAQVKKVMGNKKLTKYWENTASIKNKATVIVSPPYCMKEPYPEHSKGNLKMNIDKDLNIIKNGKIDNG